MTNPNLFCSNRIVLTLDFFLLEIVLSLQSDLGSGTLDLKLRVGIHSGPVTAGILAGQKSRFQLFGDSVNTGKQKHNNNEYHFVLFFQV